MPPKIRKPSAATELTKFQEQFQQRFGENTARLRPQRGYDVVSTGSLALDYAMGCGGYVVGRITEIWGPEGSGKSSLSLIGAANFQRKFKDKSIAWIDMERTFDWKWAETHGVDSNRFVLMDPENSEDVADMAKMAISSGLFSLVVLDSVGGMVTREEVEKVAEKDSVGTAAKVITRMVKIAAVLCANTGTTMIIINQVRANIGFTGGTTTGGGFALKHVTTHKIKLRRTQTEAFTVGAKDDKQTVGIELAATVEKNKVAPPRRIATLALFIAPSDKYGPVGIDQATEAFTVGVRTGAIEQFGAWYQLPGMEGRVQGREAVLAALRATPALLDKVRQAMLDHIADQVSDEVSEVEDAADGGEVLDFATGALTEDFEPDQEILDKLREQTP